MVKVIAISVERYEEDKRYVLVSLVADTSSDVSSLGTDGSTVVGLMEGDVMVFGSTALCADGSFGMLNSTGSWQF